MLHNLKPVLWAGGPLLALLLALAPTGALADDDAHGGHDDHRHHLAVALGGAFKNEAPKSALFVGVDYEYRINPTWGVGGYYEETIGDFDLQALGLLVYVHPTDGLKLAVGLAVERKFGTTKDKALVRLMAAYDWHVGQVTMGPMVAWDLIEDQTNVVYAGFGLGFGF